MKNTMFYKFEYCLKYKDTIVFKFNIGRKTISMVNASLLPISLKQTQHDFSLVKKFCANRTLMLNREYCKEILTACGLDSNDDISISICILCKSLSFRDNYWICRVDSHETWSQVNLYQNEFSFTISRVALTGNIQDLSIDTIIGEKIFTGELTNKGTRAKCFLRENGKLYLYKKESRDEINSEIVTFYIAEALNVPCAQYFKKTKFDTLCSVCQIFTSESYELIPYRDIMSCYNLSESQYTTNAYKTIMQISPINFIKMQLLDYITLNVDRNRDNFGLLSINNKITSLYPLFDHDSCFKGKSANGVYFPTRLTFAKTVEMLKSTYSNIYNMLQSDIFHFKQTSASKQFEQFFLRYKTLEQYKSMLRRISIL